MKTELESPKAIFALMREMADDPEPRSEGEWRDVLREASSLLEKADHWIELLESNRRLQMKAISTLTFQAIVLAAVNLTLLALSYWS